MQRVAGDGGGDKGNYFANTDLRYLNALAEQLPFPRDAVLDLLPKGAKLIDAGCGSARWPVYFRRHGYNITGIESDRKLVARVKKLHPGVKVRQGDILRLPYPAGSFDGYLSGGVIEHYEDPKPILREARRVLKKGGLLFIDVPVVNKLRAVLQPAYRGGPLLEYRYTPRELKKLLTDCGFNIVRGPVPVDLTGDPNSFVGLYCDFPYMRGDKMFALTREFASFARVLEHADPWLHCYGVGFVAKR